VNAKDKITPITTYLEAQDVTGIVEGMQLNAEAKGARQTLDVHVVVEGTPDTLSNAMVFRNRKTKAALSLPPQGALVSEKTLTMLSLTSGDMMELVSGDKSTVDLKIQGFVEHYTEHYVYLTKEAYETLFPSKEYETNTLWVTLVNSTKELEDHLSSELLQMDGVLSVVSRRRMLSNVSDMVNVMNFVVVVLIVSSAAMAFIVLYSLTSINISERSREIATIRVLGFTTWETALYVYRENLWLTLLGSILGLGLGIGLHSFVVVTAEVDFVMFGRMIHPLSFLFSFVLSIVFYLLVSLIMLPKIQRIDMVSSLKSVE
jgi:putative ABC transport system permease protein